MLVSHRAHRSHRGQALIGLIIVIAIIIAMTAYFNRPHGVYDSSIHDANMTACTMYSSQIKAAIMQYKQDNNANPPDLQSLKKYGVVSDMITAPCTFGYDPSTGALYPPGAPVPAPTASASSGNSGGALDLSSPHHGGGGQPASGGNNGVTIAPMAGTVGVHIPGSVTGGGPSNSGGGDGN